MPQTDGAEETSMGDATGAGSGDGGLPTVALALVVRDEARFLARHLAYHRALGVSRAYVYLDRCVDDSGAIARSFDFAEVVERDRDPAERFMSTYQTGVLADALSRARAEGVDWLLHVDADEFAFGENAAEPSDPDLEPPADLLARGDLRRLIRRATRPWRGGLRGLGRRVDQIILRPLEVVPTPLTAGQPFSALFWFQDGGALSRDLLDPTDGTVRRLDDWLGARRGKSLIRVAADVKPKSAHDWQTMSGGRPVTANAGFHLHFVVTDGRHWLEKYRKFSEYPATWEKGNAVRFPKQAWKEAAARMSDADALAYFDRWVAVPGAELSRLAGTREGRHLRRTTIVPDVLSAAGDDPTRAGRVGKAPHAGV